MQLLDPFKIRGEHWHYPFTKWHGYFGQAITFGILARDVLQNRDPIGCHQAEAKLKLGLLAWVVERHN